ncbi:MAG: bifunctional tetrahydrofolate synthase/dihydrofolate synthase [Gammaproteobacteria bacterium]|nr:bifunctional tetrahydrofolate synthase/dihydrofolate synthase [Gammaproteobacteria bacterium]MCP4088893.1 bifunctional tetrahydrofolate synthase/dihydrofolate synthase [Gammaproteobacteria bacterium]MCP4274909.1 bifunctional tetrahydrofolate synthase/dihydrofolate synthase [Gammaproteobacteria bacterium]MCP4832024.1 bifunctional tetrahydrofolate synthase/dihydrofolate synthase [Gammaproteobacteria bacterium]MCP4929459.1 bifunctional tetrahydrofolate synthase/dihydrofolate synthase [Gammaprot
MTLKSLPEWLIWQESLNPAEIELGLDRVLAVSRRLKLHPPAGYVFTVAGTNGKGSCAAALEALLQVSGLTTGLYTSPHLIRYNERIRINNQLVDDAILVDAFEHIESVRGDTPLTFFEFGTLAALCIFGDRRCDAWILEVGLGGRLDATNLIDADTAIITTVDLDHQDWLGDTVEKIAAEKAGIMRPGKPAFYGDENVPLSIREYAQEIGASLSCNGEAYSYCVHADTWTWQGHEVSLSKLPMPSQCAQVQIKNQALALAAVEACEPGLLSDPGQIRKVLGKLQVAGRFHEFSDTHHWVLDVAHNQQAAAVLRVGLQQLDKRPTTIVVGMLADKQVELFAQELAGVADCWLVCSTAAVRGSTADELAKRLSGVLDVPVEATGEVLVAMDRARERAPVGGRIVICGSFLVVGPALELLGLY